VGGFVDLEWRVMGLAEHVSHGPGFAAGVSFWQGKLRVGIGGISRPGPWNPATFDVTLENGATYRGQQTLSLRSDGAMAGPHIALAFPVPRVPWLAVTVPLTIGYGGFGFYLHGEDRDTPDGRKVSEWEDELFAGRDSHLGVVVDGGLRLNVVLPAEPRIRPGFDTVVRDSYAGFSGALGLELGYGL
jgi:hypothetical protein